MYMRTSAYKKNFNRLRFNFNVSSWAVGHLLLPYLLCDLGCCS